MGDLRIRLLPVGKGDCILLRFPDESWAVVDCGGDNSAARQALAILRRETPRDRPLRFVLATHPDKDHVSGMMTLLELCPIRIEAFYHCGVQRELDAGTEQGFLDYLGLAQKLCRSGEIGVVSPLCAGHTIQLNPPIEATRILVLNPGQNRSSQGPVRNARDRNNVSVVLQIEFHGTSILLPGDIEDVGWTSVLARREFRSPRVLKVPHHGSLNGKPPQRVLAQRESGRYALLSIPTGDRRFPDPRTLGELWNHSWRTRCTGWSPSCDPSDQERYPVALDDPSFSESLRFALLLAYRGQRLVVPYHSEIGCCVENELAIAPSGQIAHSRPSKTCDRRSEPQGGDSSAS